MATTPLSAGALLRDARRRARLSRAELAARAGVTQSVVSVYESGRRKPALATLASLIGACGYEFDVQLRLARSSRTHSSGPVGQRLRRHRGEVIRAATEHGVGIRGVFGGVARGEDRDDSDVDLLVALPANMGLLAFGRLQREVEATVRARVDLVPAADLKPGAREVVLAELVPL